MPREVPELLSAEAFAARLRETARALTHFATTLSPFAEARTSEADGYWRLTLAPRAANACPLDLFLRFDQLVDIAIGPEVAEDLAAGDLALYPRIVSAVTEGRVVTRNRQAAATGAILGVETRITLDDGTLWHHERPTAIAHLLGAVPVIDCDNHYVPYVTPSPAPLA
ncbi:MAG: hypothetical protein R3D27_04760 [Hyphomicrobiaceae bacterium]